MSKINVTGYPRVKVRCQFNTIPGVSYIHLEFDPHSRGNQVAGKVESCYGDIPLDDQVIHGCMHGHKCGSLFILTKAPFEEISEAVKAGMETLCQMVKASGHVSNSF